MQFARGLTVCGSGTGDHVPGRHLSKMSSERRKITLIPAARASTCPGCGALVSWQHRAAAGFYCPTCSIGLRLRPAYFALLYCIALFIVAVVVHALGFRGSGHLGLVMLALWPTYWLVLFVNLRIFPVDLEPTGDVRGLLYGEPSLANLSAAADDSVNQGLAHSPTDQPTSGRAPALHQIEGPSSLEGLGLKAGALAILVYVVWASVSAILFRVVPDLTETRNGPRGFPIRADLRKDVITFTNLSLEDWSCGVSLGSGFRATFLVGANQTHEVRYAEFVPAFSATESHVVRSIARERIWAECAASSGLTHAGYLE